MSMLRRIAVIAAIVVTGLASLAPAFAQSYTGDQYKKALWMSTRFYGGQRAGHGPNWIIMEHENPEYRTSFTNEKDGERDIVGGWFDCGDHIMYGQTFFFSVYVLALAYESFPQGYHDLYHGFDYSDYSAANDWSIAGSRPDGIPDLLQEIKYATDWMIKSIPDANTFVFQVGDRRSHDNWATAGWQSANLQTGNNWNGGTPRPIYKNPNDKPMPSFAAAALAVMSRIYRKYDAAYADSALATARLAYQYAASKNGSVGSEGGNQYGAHKDPNTVFSMAAAEMYLTTGETAYLNAISKNDIKTHYHTFDYSNSHDLAAYAAVRAMDKSGNTADKAHYLEILKTEFVNKYLQNVGGGPQNAETGIFNMGSDWGEMRYPANAAFILALYQLATGSTQHDEYIHRQIDFALGKNAANISFLVGFHEPYIGSSATVKKVVRPHHRNVFMRDFPEWDNDAMRTITIPLKNTYFGFLAGGRRNSSQFDDTNINDFKATEGGIDYQAGFVGVLGYIVSKSDAKADTSKFGTPPDDDDPSRVRFGARGNSAAAKNYAIRIRPGTVTFESTGGVTISQVSVYNMQGRRVFNKTGDHSSVTWSGAKRPKGMYLVKMTLDNGAVVRRDLVLK